MESLEKIINRKQAVLEMARISPIMNEYMDKLTQNPNESMFNVYRGCLDNLKPSISKNCYNLYNHWLNNMMQQYKF